MALLTPITILPNEGFATVEDYLATPYNFPLVRSECEPTTSPEPVLTDPETITPEEADEAFNQVLEYLRANNPSRVPVRAQRIKATFEGRENELVPLVDFIASFPENLKQPEIQVCNALSRLNRLFEELNIDLEIERVTTYRLRHRSPK